MENFLLNHAVELVIYPVSAAVVTYVGGHLRAWSLKLLIKWHAEGSDARATAIRSCVLTVENLAEALFAAALHGTVEGVKVSGNYTDPAEYKKDLLAQVPMLKQMAVDSMPRLEANLGQSLDVVLHSAIAKAMANQDLPKPPVATPTSSGSVSSGAPANP